MRTVVIALTAIGILTAPAYSQGRGKGARHSGSEQQSAEHKKKDAASEQAYKATLDRIPNKKYDPWGNIR
jgi:hypothetical protein